MAVLERTKIMLRLPEDVVASVDDFMKTLSPIMRKKVDAASMTDDGKPHTSDQQAFFAYAIRTALKRTETPRAFGDRIDDFVDSIMEKNLEAFTNRPENWWELTAIGSSLLRDDGHNPNSVKRWLLENAQKVADHHKKIGIDDPLNHNRKAGKARKMQRS